MGRIALSEVLAAAPVFVNAFEGDRCLCAAYATSPSSHSPTERSGDECPGARTCGASIHVGPQSVRHLKGVRAPGNCLVKLFFKLYNAHYRSLLRLATSQHFGTNAYASGVQAHIACVVACAERATS